MPLTIDNIQDILSQDIEIAADGNKKLTYCPLTQRFNILIENKPIWPKGERNVNYSIRHYNNISIGKEMSHVG